MIEIKERIKKIGKYFQAMEVMSTDDNNTIIYVEVFFPQNWHISPDIEEKYSVKTEYNSDNGCFVFADDFENGFENIFNAIDDVINEMYIAEEKSRLLNEKIHEIESIFNDKNISIEKLRNLKIEIEKPIEANTNDKLATKGKN